MDEEHDLEAPALPIAALGASAGGTSACSPGTT
jgi:hypothetical protein